MVLDSIRQLLKRAGLQSGHRVLYLSDPPSNCPAHREQLGDFHVVESWEGPAQGTGRRFRLATGTGRPGSHGPTLNDIDTVEPPEASFDGIVALNWWPVTSPTVAARRWRRLLTPDTGVMIVTGTDIQQVHSPGRGFARQWIQELTSAGFRVDNITETPADPHRYTALADDARRVAGLLGSALGPELAQSYVAHIDLLDRTTTVGSTYRFEIIARV